MCFRGKPGRQWDPEEAVARSRVSCGCNRRDHVEGASTCNAGEEPCFGVGEPHVMLVFLKKSPHRNAGALHGDQCHWAGVTAASVAWPTSPLVLEHCNDDG